jgi:hypothetical protein
MVPSIPVVGPNEEAVLMAPYPPDNAGHVDRHRSRSDRTPEVELLRVCGTQQEPAAEVD